MIEQANSKLAVAGPSRVIPAMIWPETIQGVAERLKALAKQIPSEKAN
jgi:hypothetical protein